MVRCGSDSNLTRELSVPNCAELVPHVHSTSVSSLVVLGKHDHLTQQLAGNRARQRHLPQYHPLYDNHPCGEWTLRLQNAFTRSNSRGSFLRPTVSMRSLFVSLYQPQCALLPVIFGWELSSSSLNSVKSEGSDILPSRGEERWSQYTIFK